MTVSITWKIQDMAAVSGEECAQPGADLATQPRLMYSESPYCPGLQELPRRRCRPEVAVACPVCPAVAHNGTPTGLGENLQLNHEKHKCEMQD